MEKKVTDNLDPNKLWGKETKKSVITQMTQMEERIKELEQAKALNETKMNDNQEHQTEKKLNQSNDAEQPFNTEKKIEKKDDWVQLIANNLQAVGVPEVLQERTYMPTK